MKIAQIAPLMESVPPRLYGGTERIVSYLTDELVQLGHEVTLFASADSITAAELVGCASMALRLDRNVRDPIPYYMLMLDRRPDQRVDQFMRLREVIEERASRKFFEEQVQADRPVVLRSNDFTSPNYSWEQALGDAGAAHQPG